MSEIKPLSAEDLARLMNLDQQATQGEWRLGLDPDFAHHVYGPTGAHVATVSRWEDALDEAAANRLLVVLMRNSLRPLLAKISGLQLDLASSETRHQALADNFAQAHTGHLELEQQWEELNREGRAMRERIKELEEALDPFTAPGGYIPFGRVDPDKMTSFPESAVVRARRVLGKVGEHGRPAAPLEEGKKE
jgi:hypothetical protein